MFRTLISILLLGGTLTTASFASESATDPASLLQETTNNIFTKVDENLEQYTANPKELEALVHTDLLPLVDVNYAARLILGRAGRGIEREKIDAFAARMSDLLVNRYAKGLLEFRSEEQLQVLPQRGALNDRLTRVRTRVQLPKGGFTPVDYAFHKTADGWKAFDIIIEGISYVTTFRNQIMPEVKSNGIDSVINRLGSGELELTE